MRTLISNIKILAGTGNPSLLRGNDLAKLPQIEDAFLIVEDQTIAAFGHMYELEQYSQDIPVQIDAAGQIVMPCWCDSHTHIIYAGSRESEYVDKIKGLSYAEIAAKGGGILNSAALLNKTREEDLFEQSLARLKEVQRLGTGAIEIKSGYGLTLEGELKMLRIAKALEHETGMLIRKTFLGAHTFPLEFRNDREGYLNLIIKEMIPAVSKENLADYIDVFCEKGFFTPEETVRICRAGAEHGLKPKLHVNQLNSIGGIEAGISCDALSLDHLETLTREEISILGKYEGVCTLLPTAAFFLRMGYQPARELIESGAAVAIASDYNPGSSPGGNMNFVASLSSIQMRMLPEEVINAGTINGAYAMEVNDLAGSIEVGKRANLIFTKPVPSLAYLTYAFGNNHIDKVMINGLFIN